MNCGPVINLSVAFFSPFRKEIEPFLPPLKPEFCVKQAMRAILTDQPMICTPRIVYMVNFMKRWAASCVLTFWFPPIHPSPFQFLSPWPLLQLSVNISRKSCLTNFFFPSLSCLCSILPFEAIVCMYRFLGADKCMYPFLAQRKEAMNNNEAKNGI